MHQGVISKREAVGGGLQRVRLAIDPGVAETHVLHAQYIEVRYEPPEVGGAPVPPEKAYFVLATAPRGDRWDLIVGDKPGMAHRLCTAAIGTSVLVSDAQGAGFPAAEAEGRPLVLAATGSGVAALFSIAAARAAGADARHTYLLYGVRERADVALEAELASLRRMGIEVAICLSREHVDEPGFFKGYVQHVAGAHAWQVAGGLVFAAGRKAMVEGMREAAPALGIRAEDVRVNF